MQRISVHITDETKQRIDVVSKAKNKVEAELIREALEVGLNTISPKSISAQNLLNLAHLAEKLPSKKNEPTDVSENLDYYAWGGKKKNE